MKTYYGVKTKIKNGVLEITDLEPFRSLRKPTNTFYISQDAIERIDYFKSVKYAERFKNNLSADTYRNIFSLLVRDRDSAFKAYEESRLLVADVQLVGVTVGRGKKVVKIIPNSFRLISPTMTRYIDFEWKDVIVIDTNIDKILNGLLETRFKLNNNFIDENEDNSKIKSKDEEFNIR